MDRPLAPSDFWAKLKYKDDDRSTGEIVAWHPLLAHSADVAAVTEDPARLRTSVAAPYTW